MASRMEKYHSTQDDSVKTSHSRLSKNGELYEKVNTNKVYTEFVSNEPVNIIDLNNDNVINSREDYQKAKLLNQNEELKTNNYSNNIQKDYEDKREKNYNINDILETAKKNRTEDDEDDKKRRIKSVEYSILSDLSQEKVKEYHEQKQKKLSKVEEDNLEELIHTITSNSLKKRIEDELLSDLLPNEDESITSENLIEKTEEIKDKTDTLYDELEQIDNTFLTKSMDLSNEDFELEGEDNSFLEDKSMGIVSKLLIGLSILLVVVIIIYVIYKFI